MFDDSVAYKCDGFVKETQFLKGIDGFLSKIAQTVRLNEDKIASLSGVGADFVAETDRGAVFFTFGSTVKRDGLSIPLQKNDIVFYKFGGGEIHKNDNRFAVPLKNGFDFSVRRTRDESGLFKKLYTLSGADGVSFPLLNANQHAIVTSEEGNLLVQGVAGSGKTNVCVDKIIFAACRGYSGKILYSTYSRGLLVETQNKVGVFASSLKNFLDGYQNGTLEVKGDFVKAVENRFNLTLSASSEKTAVETIERIADYLNAKVDYMLIDDLYRNRTGKGVQTADERFFIEDYVSGLKNYRLAGNLEKIKYLEYEIIYKEIYGMIGGFAEMPTSPEDYAYLRRDSFSKFESETIFSIACDYFKYAAANGRTDNNELSRRLISSSDSYEKYSLAILDEVQDFTQINLLMFKSVSLKLFCVGDALQMINPSFFSFAFLKRIMYEKDALTVKELKHNYRNTARLNDIIDNLNGINTECFGTHSFVLRGESVESDVPTSAVYVRGGFLDELKTVDLSNCTLVVGGERKKEAVRKALPSAEILTVSEIKGLERETVVLVDVLSDNSDKWDKLYRDAVRKKTADENSAYRYWFNLLYVGISRARRHLYVSEKKDVRLFEAFFGSMFDTQLPRTAAKSLSDLIGKGKPDDLEIQARIDEFLRLGQYSNAEFAAKSLSDTAETDVQLKRVRVFREFVDGGKYKDAGIAFWEIGLFEEAKKYFELSGNPELSALVDACSGEGGEKLDAGVVRFYPELEDNETARRLIVDTVKKDLEKTSELQKELSRKTRALRDKTAKNKQ